MRSGSCRLASQGRLDQVGGSHDPSAQVWAQDALPAGQLQLAGSGSRVNSCRRTERDLSHVHPPPPMGPQWGQVSRDNRCHHSGKPAPGEALISPHLHSHSNRKQDSHCLISRGWAPAMPAQGSARMTGHSSSLVPQAAGRSPSGAPCPAVRQVAGQVAGEAHLDVRHADSKQASWAVKGDSWVLYGGQSAPSCR